MPTNYSWHLALTSLSITNKCYAISTNYKKMLSIPLKNTLIFLCSCKHQKKRSGTIVKREI